MSAIPEEWLDEHGGDSRPPAYWELDGEIVGPDTEGATMVVRAYALGHCIWELAAHLQGLEPLPYPEMILRAFKEGTEGEPLILERLFGSEMRWTEVEGAAQTEGELRVGANRIVRFHPDAVGASRHEPDTPRLVEAKFLAPSGFTQAHNKGVETLPYGYDWQLSAMMIGLKLPALWIIGEKLRDKNKPDAPPKVGNLSMKYVDKPPHSLAEILKRVKEIYEVATGEDLATSDRPCDRPDLWPCLYRHLRPEPEGGEETALPLIGEDLLAEAERLMSGYVRFRDVESRAKADKEKLRDALKDLFGDTAGTTGNHNYRTIPTKKRTYKVAELEAVLAEHDDALENYVTETIGSRVDINPVRKPEAKAKK